MLIKSSKRKLSSFCHPVLLEFPVFSIETCRKRNCYVIPKCSGQLLQNLARVYNLVRSFDRNKKNFEICLFFLFFSLYSIVLLLFVFCSNLTLSQKYKQFIQRKFDTKL